MAPGCASPACPGHSLKQGLGRGDALSSWSDPQDLFCASPPAPLRQAGKGHVAADTATFCPAPSALLLLLPPRLSTGPADVRLNRVERLLQVTEARSVPLKGHRAGGSLYRILGLISGQNE